mmetsp:Transcript_92009/g.213841  ORF Transcript_92009/g.213841 Transcript_92009/m.213841 type:complete len:98 (+) Transcript_92009:96-389(+)
MSSRAVAASLQRVMSQEAMSFTRIASCGLATGCSVAPESQEFIHEVAKPLPGARAGYTPLSQAGRLPMVIIDWGLLAQRWPRLCYKTSLECVPDTPM